MEKKNEFKLDTSREEFFAEIDGFKIYMLNPEKRESAVCRAFRYGAELAGITLPKRNGD